MMEMFCTLNISKCTDCGFMVLQDVTIQAKIGKGYEGSLHHLTTATGPTMTSE